MGVLLLGHLWADKIKKDPYFFSPYGLICGVFFVKASKKSNPFSCTKLVANNLADVQRKHW